MSQSRLIRAVALLAALLSLACAALTPDRQSFVSVQTPHFDIVSSFGEQRTLALAQQLEFFRAGVSRAIGAESVSRVEHVPRVYVLVFDDRSLARQRVYSGVQVNGNTTSVCSSTAFAAPPLSSRSLPME